MIMSAHQPAYLAWPGWFNKVYRSDVFVILDGVQFGKQDFVNRNRILKDGKAQWLTAPVDAHGKKAINQTPVVGNDRWYSRHHDTIRQAYLGHDPKIIFKLSETFYNNRFDTADNLGQTSVDIYRWLFPDREFIWQGAIPEFARENFPGSNEMLLAICREYGCDTFLFGSQGRDYVDMPMWEHAGIKPEFQNYRCPECEAPDGTPLSIVHLLCTKGIEETRRLVCQK